jgi:hypothetical protein
MERKTQSNQIKSAACLLPFAREAAINHQGNLIVGELAANLVRPRRDENERKLIKLTK